MALAVLVVGASWLAVANHVGIRSATTSFLIVDLLGAVSFGAVGLLIVAHRPRERLAWLLVLVAVGCALTAATAQYAWYGTVTRPGALPSVTAAAWLASWSWVVGYAAFLVGGRFCSRPGGCRTAGGDPSRRSQLSPPSC